MAINIGFTKQEAYLIAHGCIGADIWSNKPGKWKLTIKKIPNYGKKITIKVKDFKKDLGMYKSKGHGKKFLGYKPDLHTTTGKNYNKAIKMGKKIAKSVGKKNSKSRMKKMALIGLWLHCRQDRYAHGLKRENIKHVDETDEISYDYKGKKPFKKRKKETVLGFRKVEKWKKNRRLKSTVDNTRQFLVSMLNIIHKDKAWNKNNKAQKKKELENVVNDYFE